MKLPILNWIKVLDRAIPWYWQVAGTILIWAIAMWLVNYAFGGKLDERL